MKPTLRRPSEGRTIAVVGDVYRFLEVAYAQGWLRSAG